MGTPLCHGAIGALAASVASTPPSSNTGKLQYRRAWPFDPPGMSRRRREQNLGGEIVRALGRIDIKLGGVNIFIDKGE